MSDVGDNGLLELLRAASMARRQPDGEPVFDPMHRPALTRAYAWAIPNEQALAVIRREAGELGILEVGSGTGYWAALLRARGVDVVATDVAPPAPELGREHNLWHAASTTWTDIERLGAVDAIAKYPDRVLLMVWPPQTNEMASEALARYEGDVLLYVGEWPHGVTGTPRFHELLDEAWRHESRVEIPIWARRTDALHVFRRSSTR